MCMGNVHGHVFELLNISPYWADPQQLCAVGTVEPDPLGRNRRHTRVGDSRPTMKMNIIQLECYKQKAHFVALNNLVLLL